MEPDPIGLEGGLNPYAYAGSNPVMFSDPSGLDFTTGFGGMLFETYNWATGNGFDWQNVKGAFQDGYNGQGSFNNQYANMAWAATNDLMNFGTLGYGSVVKNTIQTSVKQFDNVIQMTKFVKPEIQQTLMNPNNIRFTQSSIKNTFSNGGTINDLASALKTGRVQAESVPAIRLVEKNGNLYTLNNRRLEAFKQADTFVPYRMATSKEAGSEAWKFTSKNDGLSIRIRGR